MALLADAIRASNTQTAIYRARQGPQGQPGYAVIVKRVTGREEPDSEEEYDVFVDRGDQRGPWRIGALNLIEALDRMRALGLPDFNPENDQWQPTTLPNPEPPTSPADRQDYLHDRERP